MFWGLVLKTNKRYSQKVTKPFHVSQAVLDLGTLSEPNAVIQVWANIDDTDHLIANVSKSSSHVILDLTFTEGESVAFYSKGSGTVDFGMGGEEEEEDESEEEELDLEAAKKLMKEKKDKKGAKVAAADEEDEDDDDSDDMDLDGLDAELEGEEEEDSDDMDDDDEDDDDEDDDEEDEEDDDEEDDEEEIQEKPAKKAKLDVNAKQNGLTNGKLSKKDTEQKQKQQPQKNQQEQKQKNQNQQNQQQKSGPKKLSGGIIIEDMRVGKGPEAKTGRKVSVYYEGRLKSNNKVFDSTKSGEGFKFHLGRGEVIRGWDVGIVGMKVGSKRRITCPPNVAYGPKGSPPVIPANATLVFDVELRGVN